MAESIWQANLRDAILLDPLILIHGNVKDLFYLPPRKRERLPAAWQERSYVSFDVWLALEFEEMGFDVVVLYDTVDGAVVLRPEMVGPFTAAASRSPACGKRSQPVGGEGLEKSRPATAASQHPLPPLPTSGKRTSPGDKSGWMVCLDVKQDPAVFFRTLYDSIFPRDELSVAVVCRFSDRYLSYTDRQGDAEKELSLLIQKAAMTIRGPTPSKPIHSRVALLFDLEGSIPQELSVQAPFAHTVRIPPPTLEEREQFFRDNHCSFASEPNDRFDPEEDPGHLRLIANLADGLKMQDMVSLIALSHRERLGLGKRDVKVLLDRFRYGTVENAWAKINEETLRNAKDELRKRVKGQDEVIDEIVPTLIRAKMGMSDLGASRHSNKPRGAFFFVGPTGVGKTELSKAIAALIFGDEAALIRFDMSEYSEEHQQARLIGAPPGYVGFDQGGQLTNAITEKPFSVVLFDEIEKAHGRILDKFLQVLDDGRLTDGRGRTVYFSEAILIFTSNIGTAPPSELESPTVAGAVSVGLPGDPGNKLPDYYAKLGALGYDDLCRHFRDSVRRFFVNKLGRPEILNRIGEDNILVFNFLNDPKAKEGIVAKKIEEVQSHLTRQYRVGMKCSERFIRLLMVHPNGFERNGARGVENLLRKFVLNPLAERLFFDRTACEGKTLRVDYFVTKDRIGEEPFDKARLTYEWENR